MEMSTRMFKLLYRKSLQRENTAFIRVDAGASDLYLLAEWLSFTRMVNLSLYAIPSRPVTVLLPAERSVRRTRVGPIDNRGFSLPPASGRGRDGSVCPDRWCCS